MGESVGAELTADERGGRPDAAGIAGTFGTQGVAAGLSAGIFLFVLESDRLAALQHVETPSVIPAVTMLVPLAILGVLTALLCVRPARRPAPLPLLAAAAVTCSLGVALRYGAQGASLPWAVQGLARALFSIGAAALMFGWLQRVVGFGRAFVVRCFGTGAVVAGCLGALTIVLERGAAVALVVALPLLGVLALRRVGCPGVADAGGKAPAGAGRDARGEGDGVRWNALRAIARGYRRDGSSAGAGGSPGAVTHAPLRPFVKLMPFLCYAVLFGNIHFSWVYLQSDGHFGVWVQLGASVGTIAAGIVAMGLSRLHWGRALDSIMGLLLTAFALVALWLSTFLTSGFVFAYLVVLNLAQKLTFLMMLLLGFSFADDDAECVSLCSLAYFSFFVGTSVSFMMGTLQAASALNVGAIVALAVVLVADAGDVVLLYGGGPGDAGRPAQGDGAPQVGRDVTATRAGTSDDAGPAGAAAVGGEVAAPGRERPERTGQPEAGGGFDSLPYACHLIAERHGLTRREEEILQLLVRGRSTARIADALCITPATTRTHLRNIYAKLDVHSQQEVLDLFERERGSLRG